MLFRRPSTRFATIGLAVAALVLSGCAQSQRDEGSSDGGGTFVFAGSAEPVTFDPFFASDGETFRPVSYTHLTLPTILRV